MQRRTTVNYLLCGLTALSMAVYSAELFAKGDANVGREKAVNCVGCHGADGIGKSESYPNLQGQKYGYLKKQLQELRSGVRKAPHMSAMARSLSDQDIEDLSTFFSSLTKND